MKAIGRLATLGIVGAGFFLACGESSPPPDGAGGDAGASSGGSSSGDGGSAGNSGGSGGGGQAGESGAGGSDSGGASGKGGQAGQAGQAGDGGATGECDRAADCSDEESCNGEETCKQHECVKGKPLPDGTPCTGPAGEKFVCQNKKCTESSCGNGVVDSDQDEECDDANQDDTDGCKQDCHFTCSENDACDDGNSCNGAERCASHLCKPGTQIEPKGTSCTGDTAGTFFCDGTGQCLPSACGDGVIDPATEDCEETDGPNGDDTDGCTAACQYTCEVDLDCADDDFCNGPETCNVATHTCAPATEPLNCDDDVKCTKDTCEPALGCKHTLIDEDGDGYPPGNVAYKCELDGVPVAEDCDDENADVNPGVLVDVCDEVDNDCDEDVDEDPETLWYEDCDKDTFARKDAASYASCARPTRAAGCAGGVWTDIEPTDDVAPGNKTTDCVEFGTGTKARDYRPDQVLFMKSATAPSGNPSWDYNCDGTDEKLYPSLADTAECQTHVNTGGGCGEFSGWDPANGGSVAACGKSKPFVECLSPGGGSSVCIVGEPKSVTQLCR